LLSVNRKQKKLNAMDAYLPTKKEYADIAYQQAKKAFDDALPEALRKATQRQWLDTSDVMKILKCSRRHVQHLRDSEQIVYHQTGRTIRYKYQDVTTYLNEGKVSGGGAQ
jgi:3-methyladenine DNA glycosylase Tag